MAKCNQLTPLPLKGLNYYTIKEKTKEPKMLTFEIFLGFEKNYSRF